MITLPSLVQDFNIRQLTNAVLVGTMKFTRDQFNLFFTAQNPAPARLAAQFSSFSSGYDRLNAAYALTRESLITVDIMNLDTEGDYLFMTVKEMTRVSQRMTLMPARKQAADRNMVFLKKYRVDVRENMISEWSKIQQLCEEANASAQITADMAATGLTEVMARLTAIADELRDRLTDRNAELPAQKAMQQAREAIYGEYRTLIDILNAYALTDADTTRYQTLVAALNANIDYVRIHAMTNGGETQGDGGGSGENGNNGSNGNDGNDGNNEPTNPNEPGTPDEPINPGTGGNTGGGNSGGGDNGGSGGDNGGDTGGGGSTGNGNGEDE